MKNYIYQEEGNEKSDIKVLSNKGDIKWFPKHIAEDKRLMEDAGFTIVFAPLKVEPIITEENVAEATQAKRERKSKTE
jgi:pantothenate synthetase